MPVVRKIGGGVTPKNKEPKPFNTPPTEVGYTGIDSQEDLLDLVDRICEDSQYIYSCEFDNGVNGLGELGCMMLTSFIKFAQVKWGKNQHHALSQPHIDILASFCRLLFPNRIWERICNQSLQDSLHTISWEFSKMGYMGPLAATLNGEEMDKESIKRLIFAFVAQLNENPSKFAELD